MAIKSKNPSSLILGLLIAVTATVTFGLTNVSVLENSIEPYAGWIFVGGFIMVYLLSDRELNRLKDHEAVAFIVPIIAAASVQMMQQPQELLAEYDPYLGFALTGITLVGFYALSNDMDLKMLSLEIIIATVLATVAAVQFDILSIEVLNSQIDEISIWVFVVSLAIAYFISERDIGTMSNAEIAALLLGIGSYVGYKFVPEVQNVIVNNNPVSGVIAVVLVMLAYYVVMNNGEFIP